MLSDKILEFLFNLKFPLQLPGGIEVLNPFSDAETARVVDIFYKKYYSDDNPRYCIVGINPGRFGGGITGVPFTDPIRLKTECGIENPWAPRQELSSVFIYDVIHAFGSVADFYNRFYFTAVSPLGFTKNGKNLNYYDDKLLAKNIVPFAEACFRRQLEWGLHKHTAFCLGEGTNFKYLSKINSDYNFFHKIVPLPHPRFIMQYKLKTKDSYISKYLEELLAVK